MNELSRLLMVTGGNVTAIVDQLEKEGLVERLDEPADRRAFRIRLTRAGEQELRRDGARARAMGGRAARRPVAPRAATSSSSCSPS